MFYYFRLERLARDKRPNLLGPFIRYEEDVKCFEYDLLVCLTGERLKLSLIVLDQV